MERSVKEVKSREDLFDAMVEMAERHKSIGGCGRQSWEKSCRNGRMIRNAGVKTMKTGGELKERRGE